MYHALFKEDKVYAQQGNSGADDQIKYSSDWEAGEDLQLDVDISQMNISLLT